MMGITGENEHLSVRLACHLELEPEAVFSTGRSNGGDLSYFLTRQAIVIV